MRRALKIALGATALVPLLGAFLLPSSEGGWETGSSTHLHDHAVAAGTFGTEAKSRSPEPAHLSAEPAPQRSPANHTMTTATKRPGTRPQGEGKQPAAIDVAYETARHDPLAALTQAIALPSTPERDNLLAFAVGQWAATDPQAAASWAMQIPDADLQQRLIAAAAVATAEQDVISAATLVGTRLRPGKEQDRAAVAIVLRWAQTSPQAAANWVCQFPDSATRNIATKDLLSIWTGEDAAAAGHWLNSLPPGSMRNAGETAYAEALAFLRTDPDPALQPEG